MGELCVFCLVAGWTAAGASVFAQRSQRLLEHVAAGLFVAALGLIWPGLTVFF